MLSGTYPMNVDSKSRVTLPAPFRKEMDKTIMLVPFSGCVNGFTPEGFEAWTNSLFEQNGQTFDPRDRKSADLKRLLWSSAVTIDVDSAGRLALGKLDVTKPGTRERLGLTGSVVILGVQDHFEIWNSGEWDRKQSELADNLDALFFND